MFKLEARCGMVVENAAMMSRVLLLLSLLAELCVVQAHDVVPADNYQEILPCGVQDPDLSSFPRASLFQRRNLQDVATVGQVKALVIRGAMSDLSTDDLMTDAELGVVLDQVAEFYRANSGGRQMFSFDIYKPTGTSFVDFPDYNSKNCEQVTEANGQVHSCPSDIVRLTEVENALENSIYSRFLYIYTQDCRCFAWKGLGQVPGKVTWTNGEPDLRVLGHELGHNNGAFHSNVGVNEYGNEFSIMGGGRHNMHFTTPGKISMLWLDETTHVRTLSRPGKCFGFVGCDESCTIGSPCEIDLFAHDQGSYVDGQTYSIRIMTDKFEDENIFVEYRKALPESFSATEDGVHIVWSIKRGGTVYGPTVLEDYITVSAEEQKTSEAQTDSYLPEGKTWVYDFDNIGAVVTAVRKGVNFMSMSIYFTDTIAASASMRNRELLRDRSDVELGCGTSDRIITLDEASPAFLAFETTIQRETSVSVTLGKIDCSGISLPEDAGLYVYPTYPLQLEKDVNADPELANGALHFRPFECGDAADSSTFDVSVKSLTTPRSLEGYNVLDFSTANYFVLNKGSLSSEVQVSIGLGENANCYSSCDSLVVTSSVPSLNNIAGVYDQTGEVNDAATGLSMPRYMAQGAGGTRLEFSTSRQRWEFVTTSSTTVAHENITPNIVFQFPHVVPTWSSNVQVQCLSRAGVTTDGLNNDIDESLELILIIAGGIAAIAGVALVLATPAILRRTGGKKQEISTDISTEFEMNEDHFLPGVGRRHTLQEEVTVTVRPMESADEISPVKPQSKRKSWFSTKRKEADLKQPPASFKQVITQSSPEETTMYQNEQRSARKSSSQSEIERYEAFMQDRQNDERKGSYGYNPSRNQASGGERVQHRFSTPRMYSRGEENENVSDSVREYENEQAPPPPRFTKPRIIDTESSQQVVPGPPGYGITGVMPGQSKKCLSPGCKNWRFSHAYCRFHMKETDAI